MEVLIQNFSHIDLPMLVMWAIGVNVSGQIASVIAGGLILALVKSAIGG